MSDAPAVDDTGPFEEQRQIYDLLSQETRHLILQFVFGHPAHLPSLAELAHMIPKNKAAIRDQLEVLAEADIIACYDHPPNESDRDLPSQFWGLTEYGVEILDEYNYLRGLPVARALYDNTRLSEKARRHGDAPRPELPDRVSVPLRIDDGGDTVNLDRIARYIRKNDTLSANDQLDLVTALYEAGVGPEHEGLTRTELLDEIDVELDHRPRTVLETLVDLDLLAEIDPPGPDVFAISERVDDIVNGHVTEEAEENLKALIAHIDDELQSVELEGEAAGLEGPPARVSTPSVALPDGAGRTIRSILADEFGVSPEQVTEHLRSGDPVDRLNTAVAAVESAEEVSLSEEYGRIVFVRPAYRYRLTERAVNLAS